MSSNAEVYEAVTARMVAALDAGTVPWQRPWANASGRPRSMSTRRPYRGANSFLLSLTAGERGYSNPWWGTMNQINKLGGRVRKGQNRANGLGATGVMLWKSGSVRVDDPDHAGSKINKKVLLARLFYVYNAEQCEGLPARFYPVPGEPVDEITSAQDVLDGYLSRPGAPTVSYGGDRAYYQPGTDAIRLPELESYISPEARYAVAFHESGHSTGHRSRLNRPGIDKFDHFGSDKYSREELVAEMTAALLCALTGTDTSVIFENSAAYLANWAEQLTEDPRLIVAAASQAFEAADLITGESAEATGTEPAHQDDTETEPAHEMAAAA